MQSPEAGALFAKLYQTLLDFGAHPNDLGVMASTTAQIEGDDLNVSSALIGGSGQMLDFFLRTLSDVGVCALLVFRDAIPARFAEKGL